MWYFDSARFTFKGKPMNLELFNKNVLDKAIETDPLIKGLTIQIKKSSQALSNALTKMESSFDSIHVVGNAKKRDKKE